MSERITSYLFLGVVLALVINQGRLVGSTIRSFATGVGNIVGGIVNP